MAWFDVQKLFKIKYETANCKDCNYAVYAYSKSEAWAKFALSHVFVKYKNVVIIQHGG